ncbi:dihydrofolate reductase family protein [Streptomyces sp. H27-D2]|uniref:dihydrofolate reductase family protein n=1 Tax=Streptomyces sp. H27-D2 TaxID=3046304 RepID=UPI002DBD4944|nr:dihydrofolate reductase family protein [Streptomyces sp. H27-D2]MEC4020701.1 dihydrofolate reductase family protein [Streptomyces sp. H27-D2]
MELVGGIEPGPAPRVAEYTRGRLSRLFAAVSLDPSQDAEAFTFHGADSRTLERTDWNTTIVREVVTEEVLALKAQPGGDLALGGADLAASFMHRDLVDEYRLYVHPVVLGQGKPLFPSPAATVSLRHAETRTFGNGVVLLRYHRR